MYHDFCILTFGDGSYSKSHSDLEVVDSTADPGATVDGVVEVANVDEPDSHTDERDDFGELLTELIQLLLQGGLLLLSGSHLVTDFTDLSGDCGGNHNSDSLASSNVSALGKQENVLVPVQEKEEGDTKKLTKGTLTEKSMFFLSWLTALRSGTDSVCLITLTDSPENKVRKEVREG